MTEYTLAQWVLFFYIYCFIGWVWESSYVSVCKRKPVNRGFLKGPFLPIYGSGAICILFVTIPFRGNVPAMCIAGMVSATVLEYVTGYVMEKLFRVRYWDYTGKFMNINGHVCLSSTLCWGVMTVLLVDVFHVRIEHLVLALNQIYVESAVLLLTPVLTADFVTSFNAAIHLRDLLIQKERIALELQKLADRREELEARLSEAGDKAREQIRQELRELYMNVGAIREKHQAATSKAIRGLLKRNPSAVSLRHRESFAELKNALSEKLEEIRSEKDDFLEKFENLRGEKNDFLERFESLRSEKDSFLKGRLPEKNGESQDQECSSEKNSENEQK